MSRRPYRMNRREDAAEATRRRIVEATFALHTEQGVAATSMKQIAERAGVSVGAVYHHFPTLDDAIGGCAAHVRATFPFPDDAPIAAKRALEDRVEAFLDIAIAFAASFPQAENARLEAPVSRHVASFFEDEAAHRQALARLALAPADPAEEAARTLAGLADVSVVNSFVRAGLAQAAAADTVKAMARAWLADLARSPETQDTEHADQDR
jgi:AcrR family transcriptional regulator